MVMVMIMALIFDNGDDGNDFNKGCNDYGSSDNDNGGDNNDGDNYTVIITLAIKGTCNYDNGDDGNNDGNDGGSKMMMIMMAANDDDASDGIDGDGCNVDDHDIMPAAPPPPQQQQQQQQQLTVVAPASRVKPVSSVMSEQTEYWTQQKPHSCLMHTEYLGGKKRRTRKKRNENHVH